MPILYSRWALTAARMRSRMTMGKAATVTQNSDGWVLGTMTRNCTMKPTMRKKSNFKMAM